MTEREHREGLMEAARFSYRCGRAEQLGISRFLREFVLSGGRSDMAVVESSLKKLVSYLYYCLIAQQNGIVDPFAMRVVDAHWIGTDLLKQTTVDDVKILLRSRVKEFKLMGLDKKILAWYFSALMNKRAYPHHSFYAATTQSQVPACTDNGRKRCQVDIGRVERIRNKRLIVQTEIGLYSYDYGLLREGSVKVGDRVFVHLGVVRRLVGEYEDSRLKNWEKCSLEALKI